MGDGTGKGFHIPPKLSRRRVFASLPVRCERVKTYRLANVMLWELLTCGQHVRCGYEASRHDAIEDDDERQKQRQAATRRRRQQQRTSQRTLGGQIALSARRKGEPPWNG